MSLFPSQKIRPTVLGIVLSFLFLGAAPSGWTLDPSEVLILVNKDAPVSSLVAAMYQKSRAIPAANILELSLGTSRGISREEYRARIAAPVREHLEKSPEIRCIVTTSGVPYRIRNSGGRQDGGALDNELAGVLRDEPRDLNLWQPNPLDLRGQNLSGTRDPRTVRMVYVARLDGPDLETVTRMVEDAVAVELTGLQGPVFVDSRGMDGITSYEEADTLIRAAGDRLAGAGFQTTLDMAEATWTQPEGGVGNQAEGSAFYLGWYKLRNFQDIFGKQGLARGAIAWHVASGEAVDLWSPNEKGWCVNLLRRGAAVTLGPVREPYVSAFPKADVFVELLLGGATVAESYWLSLPNISWAMVILGDPLYRPFAHKAKPSLVARAYIAADSNHVLEKGETSALLVQLESIGPVGSATPSLSATAEAGAGLTAASGTVAIPPLRAGERTVVRVPSVTAGSDPTGMFRLHLNAQGERADERRIVVEGRVGFSRLTGSLEPARQMFVSPDGQSLITVRNGKAFLVEPEILRSRLVDLPQGLALAAAEFSPDGSHVALAVIDLAQRKGGHVLMDRTVTRAQNLPPGTVFLRWLRNDRALLRRQNTLIDHSIRGEVDSVFETPDGWSGNVIPGTNVQVLSTNSGRFAIKKGSEALQEVLQGPKIVRDAAVADDLSLFAGIDQEKRLWVQHGLNESPVAVATGVEQALWGPISRRVLIRDTNGLSRAYDGRDRSWMDLGTVLAAYWSPDEERLVFLEAARREGRLVPTRLALLDGRRVRRLGPFERIGQLAGATFSADGETLFLLAGLAGGLDVWMTVVPTSQAAQEEKLESVEPAEERGNPSRRVIIQGRP
jgi:uncharacterized protein (TIGR03790 family)